MRAVIFWLCFAAALISGFFTVIGLYIAAGLLAVLIAAVTENLAEDYKVKVSYEKLFLHKGEAPAVIFSGKKRLRGTVLCENLVTGERSANVVDIKSGGRYELPAQDNCGGLLIRFMSFRRSDLLGITKRTAVCYAEESITVLPDPIGAEIYDIAEAAVGENEPDGAREARPDEPLRRVNLKLTHRFGKPYLNTYTPERTGDLWLYADYGAGDRAGILAEQICGLAQVLTEQGIDYGLAVPYGEDGFKFIENADSEAVMSEVLRFPMYKQVGDGFLEKLCGRIDDGRIIAFSRKTGFSDERLTVIDGG